MMLGGILGFVTKKLIKAIAVLCGLEFGLFLYLDYHNIIDVNWHVLSDTLATANVSLYKASSWLLAVGAPIPLGAGFVSGFIVGFKRS